MKQATRSRLNQINREFYATTANDFDATRTRAWAGWQKLPALIDLPVESLMDIGCGNGRFALFLVERQQQPFAYFGIDNNRQLLDLAAARLRGSPQVNANLIEHDLIAEPLPECRAQLMVLFGILHHVPGFGFRKQLMSRAAEILLPGGYLVMAAWRFYEVARFRERIVPWNDDIEVETNDYLLDWRRGERAFRYCHYINDDEHDDLIVAAGLSSVSDYRADGASGSLNRYSVLKKNLAERDSTDPAPIA